MFAILLRDFAEMITHDRQHNGITNQIAPFGIDPVQESPELFARRVEHSKLEKHAEESYDVLFLESLSGRIAGRESVSQGGAHALVIFFRAVDGLKDSLVAVNQNLPVHLRDKIQR